MSIKTRIKNYIKNFSLREALKSLVEITIIVTLVDIVMSPQNGLGKIALDAITFVPEEIYMAITALLIVWFALESIEDLDNKIRDIPLPLMVASILGTMYFSTQYILATSFLPNNIFGGTINVLFGLLLGGLIWFISGIAVASITMSILGIDPKENAHKNSNTNDPYNDKHAAKILNQEESS